LDMTDHPAIAVSRTTLLLVEVKLSGPCRFNPSWWKDGGDRIRRVIDAVGCYHHESAAATAALLHTGRYVGDSIDAILAAVASTDSYGLRKSLPGAIQLPWHELLYFIFERFIEYADPKADHDSWDQTGKDLYNAAMGGNYATFCDAVHDLYG